MNRARRGDLAIYVLESTYVHATRGTVRRVECLVAGVTSVTREGWVKKARGPWSRGPRDLIEGAAAHLVGAATVTVAVDLGGRKIPIGAGCRIGPGPEGVLRAARALLVAGERVR